METRIYPERITIVLNSDGSLKAVQMEQLSQVVENGEVVAENQLPAEPVNEALLKTIFPSQPAALIVQNEQLISDMEQKDAEISVLSNRLMAANGT